MGRRTKEAGEGGGQSAGETAEERWEGEVGGGWELVGGMGEEVEPAGHGGDGGGGGADQSLLAPAGSDCSEPLVPLSKYLFRPCQA